METTTITLHTQFQIGRVDPHIFGGFLEHMGRAMYEGVYHPECAHADEDGFRTDVMGVLRRLSLTAMRYPGGNFASGYHWLDGIGPRDKRPTVRELAWQSLEPNRFGTDEYIKLCRKMSWTPMLTVNLGTGTPEEARNWVEYCNGAAGTRYADMRAANGSIQPHAVKLWCLGNELLIQSIFYPFEMFSKRRDGISLKPVVTGPAYEGKTNGRVNWVDASAILNSFRLHVFATNRSLDHTASVRIKLADQAITALESAELLTGPDAQAANSFEQPDVIQSQPFAAVRIASGEAAFEMPPLSVMALTFQLG